MRTARRLVAAALIAVGGPWAVVSGAAAADVFETEPIVVTAGRGPLAFGPVGRVAVIGRGDLARIPAASVEEAIAQLAGVDVRQRGPRGVQADVSVRGGTFEQTLVLIDGVKVADPQTGHHAFDLPLALEDVERIEVLRGAASRAWGPNAFAGVVNIVTRRAAGRSLTAQAQGGEHGTFRGAAALSADAGAFAGRVSASGSRTDGYRHNTDHEIGTFTFSGTVPAGPIGLDVLAGHAEKDFGANGFYSDRFPNQREDTGTTFVSIGEDFVGERFVVAPRLSWRRHRDHYVLDGDNPALYENRHRTDVFGAEIRASLDSAAGATSFGAELAGESIDSDSLGDHDRRRGGIYGNHRVALGGRASLAAGAFAAYHSGWGWEVWPGADATLEVGGGLRLLASADRSYRVPTYTELYYDSPTSVGDPGLRPEEAWTWEAGADWAGGGHRLSAGFFRREGTNLVDWVRADSAQPWRAANSSRVRTDGVEAGWEWRPAAGGAGAILRSVSAGYTFLDSDRDAAGLESKYVLDHLRHQAVATLEHALGFGVTQRWRVAWEDRMNGGDHVVVDTRLRRPLSRGEVFVDATNLLGAAYELVPGVPQPGRWVMVGVQLGLGPW
jgi:iron complex outermembrane receptor protein